MNFTKLIKKLRAITHKHYEENSVGEENFYSDFALSLHSFFEDSVEGYLFSFPFVSEKGKQTNPSKKYLVSGKLPPNEAKDIENQLEEGGKQLRTGNCVSITEVMIENLTDDIQSLLIKRIDENTSNIKYERLNEYVDEFHVIDLKKDFTKNGDFTSDFEEIAEKLKIEKSEYEKLNNRFETFVQLPITDHFVYLIKPYTKHKQFNVVLILGVKIPLQANDFHLLRLLIYRFVSEVAIKKIEEAEKTITKTSINYSIHAIKTTLGGLMDKPLTSLENKYPNDNDVRMVKESKDIVEELAAILNLVTKLEEGGTISLDDLKKSKLFSEEQNGIDVKKLFQKIERHRKDKGDAKKVVTEENNINELIPIIKYQSLYASEHFYLLFFLTLIENAFDHGYHDWITNSTQLKLNYDSSTKEFSALNLAKDNSPVPSMESVQGNIKLFHSLLEALGIGYMNFEKEERGDDIDFKTILKLL